MKRFVLLSILSLCQATLVSVTPVFTDAERNFCKEALEDDVKAAQFGDYIAADFIDIDAVSHSGMCSVAGFISFAKDLCDDTIWGGKGMAGDQKKFNRINNIILPKAQPHRSYPPEAQKLRDYIKAALDDDANMGDLANFLQGKGLNIDLIHYIDLVAYERAFPLTSIAQMLEHFAIHDPIHGARAQKILDLPEIKKFRSDKAVTGETLYKAFEKDPSRLRDFKVSLKKLKLDVDDIYYDAFKTIGTMIDERVSKADGLVSTAKNAIHELAWLVRPYRKNKMKEFRDLLQDYIDDTKKLEPLKKWFTDNPFDVDGVKQDPTQFQGGSTIGSYIDALKKEEKGPVAALVLPYRAAKIKAFRGLLTDYEVTYIKKDALKKIQDWFEEHPFDIDAVLYDSTLSSSQTFGDKINAFKDAQLGAIFNAKRGKPNPEFKPPVLSGRSRAIMAALVTTIAIVIWHTYRSHQNKQEDADTETAVS